MTDASLDRRALLKLLGAVTLTWAAPAAFASQETATAEALPGVPGVEAKALEDLAKAYGELGEDPGISAMIERLSSRSLDDEDFLEALRQEMKEDFAEDRVVPLYGWHVSRTEGRLFAAAHALLGQ